MRTVFRLLLITELAVATPAALRPAEPPPPTSAGRVLVLENGRALEGDIRCEGGQYCVRRTIGEVWLPEDKVLKLCASWEEAFAFMGAQANGRDPDEHLRLARWCMVYGLHTHALAEARAAVQMRPRDAEARQLLALLERSVPAAPNPPPAPRPQAPTPAGATPAIDLSAESLGLFATRVQPVLMNTCASCHARSRATAFTLCRTSGNSTASRRATQQNLAAALAQLDPDHPHASPLLMRAVTDHGKSGLAPLKAQSPPYRILQEWIDVTLATNPFLREQHRAVPTGPVTMAQQPTAAAPALAGGAPIVSTSEPAAAPLPGLAAPADDFDPAPFNQQVRPQP